MSPLMPPDDPRLTAYALGELEPTERAEVEGLLVGSPEARQELEELRGLMRVLEHQLHNETAPGLSNDQKQRIIVELERGSKPDRLGFPQSGFWRRGAGLGLLAASLLLAGTLTFRFLQTPNKFESWGMASDEKVSTFNGAKSFFAQNDSKPEPTVAAYTAPLPKLAAKDHDNFAASAAEVVPADLASMGEVTQEGGVPTASSSRAIDDTAQLGRTVADGNPVAPGILAKADAEREQLRPTAPPVVELALNVPAARPDQAGGGMPGSPSVVGPADAISVPQGITGEAKSSKLDSAPVATAGLPALTDADLPAAGTPGRTDTFNYGMNGPSASRFAKAGQPQNRPEDLRFGASVAKRESASRRYRSEDVLARGIPAQTLARKKAKSSVESGPAEPQAQDKQVDQVEDERLDHRHEALGVSDSLLENPPVPVTPESHRVTFALSPETGSYSIMRDALRHGTLPSTNAIHIEELINHFNWTNPAASGEASIVVQTELTKCPWNSRHNLLRIAFQGRSVEPANGDPVAIARDLNVEVDFHPESVWMYQPLGYERRAIEPEQFQNVPQEGAGLVSGGSFVVLYELAPLPDKKRKEADELALVRLRYKKPLADEVHEMVHAVSDQVVDLQSASSDTRFAAAVGRFGMILKAASDQNQSNLDLVLDLARSNLGVDAGGQRAEFVGLVEQAKRIMAAQRTR